MTPDSQSNFADTIRENHGCNSSCLRSITVTVELGNGLRWRGAVEVFALHDHCKTSIAYAWTYRSRGRDEIVTVLGIPPIDSAQAAVKSVLGSATEPRPATAT